MLTRWLVLDLRLYNSYSHWEPTQIFRENWFALLCKQLQKRKGTNTSSKFISNTSSSLIGKAKNTNKQFSQVFVLCLGFSEKHKTQTMSPHGRKVQPLTLGKISSSVSNYLTILHRFQNMHMYDHPLQLPSHREGLTFKYCKRTWG